jgi:hypothetical protein
MGGRRFFLCRDLAKRNDRLIALASVAFHNPNCCSIQFKTMRATTLENAPVQYRRGWQASEICPPALL